jgi:hypothetical protein
MPIFCTRSGECLAELPGPSQHQVTTHVQTDGRPIILSTTATDIIRVWDGDDYQLLFERQLPIKGGDRMRTLLPYCETESGSLRVVALEVHHHSRLHVLEGETGGTLHVVVIKHEVECLGGCYSSAGRRQRVLVGARSGHVLVLEPETGEIVFKSFGHQSLVNAVAAFEAGNPPAVSYILASHDCTRHRVLVSRLQPHLSLHPGI